MSEKILNTWAIVTDTDELSLLLKITDGDESLHVLVKPEGVKRLICEMQPIIGKVAAGRNPRQSGEASK